MADAVPAPEEKKAGSPLLMQIVLVLLLTLVGAGAGFAVGALLGTQPATQEAAVPPPKVVAAQQPKPEPAEKPAEGHGGEAKNGEAAAQAAPAITVIAAPTEDETPVTLVALPPIITNLAAPEGAWVRVEGALLASQETSEKPEVLAEKMASEILTYLRTVRLAQIEGASGFLAFRDDLDDLVATTSQGAVKKFLIKSLVVE